MIRAPSPHRAAYGFTLVELAIALGAAGLIAFGAMAAARSMMRSATAAQTDAGLAAMVDQVVAFAKARNRLPCPDTVGAGNEGLVNGSCPDDVRIGWLPYLALGMAQPAPGRRLVYGVYRGAAADPVSTSMPDTATLARRLVAGAQAAPSDTEVHVGDDAASGGESCTERVNNPAFAILDPGEDRDGDGTRVDGIYADRSAATGIGLCFPAQTRPNDSTFDDRAVAVGFYALVAKLNP